jgi:hypothetical protein
VSPEQCLERSQMCFAMAQNHRNVTERKDHMRRASWLWLFVWSGMFE